MGRTAPRASHPMSRLIMAATLVSLVPTCAMAQSLSNPAKDAYWQGRIAYHAGECKLAVGSFAYAARHKIFSSRHYLAKIFGNTDGDLADHAKAFNLLSAIAREYWDIDPAYSFRAKVVSDVLARLGQYHLRGIPQLNMPADRRVATDYFKLAAEDYNNEDAQFALAKLYLKRDDNRWILARGRKEMNSDGSWIVSEKIDG